MNDVRAMCSAMPEIRLAAGDVLIEEGVRTNRLFVLKSGAFDVVRNGVRIVRIDDPGSFLGEISALLGSAPTATAVADGRTCFILRMPAGGTSAAPARNDNPSLPRSVA